MAEPIRILIADDHPPTRAGIRSVLEHEGFDVCWEAGDATTALEGALLHRPDICLVDINMPGGGVAAARRLATDLPTTAVVMLTASRHDDDLLEAVRAGARGYLLKDMDPGRLAHALRGVLEGEAALPRDLMARVLAEVRGEPGLHARLAQKGFRLTEREREVLDLMRRGLTTVDIAERLFVSPATVRSHVAALLKKLGVPDREAALRLLEDGQEG